MIFVIAGATATGKSEIAVKLAQNFNGYIINADSRQVFKELNIGTAKPSTEEIQKTKVQHELFGHVSIDESYNLYRYQKDVKDILEKNKSKLPFLVGGTGLYIDSVVYNYELKETKENQRKELEQLTLQELQEKAGGDLERLNESDRNNPRRLIRFLERDKENYKKGDPLNHIYIVLDIEFDVIEKNIKKRINKMFENGLLEENEKLFKEGKHEQINTIGYREFREFFQEKLGLEEVKEKIFLNTRKYAKRQITWFKRNKEDKNVFFVKDYDEIYSIVLGYIR